jgi:hypothetical protein
MILLPLPTKKLGSTIPPDFVKSFGKTTERPMMVPHSTIQSDKKPAKETHVLHRLSCVVSHLELEEVHKFTYAHNFN